MRTFGDHATVGGVGSCVKMAPGGTLADGVALGRRRLPWRVLLAAASLSLVLGAALYEGVDGGRSVVPVAVRTHGFSREGLLSVPVAARGPVSAALGGDSPAYRVSADHGGFRAASPAQHLSTTFTSSGASVTSGATRVALSLRGIGYGSSLTSVAAAAPDPHVNRVLYAHPGLSEWYANGPLGLEQGFTITRAPAGHAAGPLTLAIALSSNAQPALAKGGKSVTLSRAGKTVLRYTGLSATDARGRVLRSWLALEGGRLLLRVDASGARYPLRIDPFVQQARLTPSEFLRPDEVDGAGRSVAISGNTIVAGATAYGFANGAAYVFTAPATGWANATQVATLTPSVPRKNAEFGRSVAISGNTIVVGQEGAAYVFVEPVAGWTNATQTATLTAPPAVEEGEADDYGESVAIAGNTIVVSSPSAYYGKEYRGALYVYTKPAGGWPEASITAKLTSSSSGCGETCLLGRNALAMSEETIVADAGYADQERTPKEQKQVEVFEKPETGWINATQTATLTPGGNDESQDFGGSVAISDSTIVVGTPDTPLAPSPHRNQGALYVYTERMAGWSNATPTATLTGSAGREEEHLGFSVAISGGTIVGSTIGSALVFVEPEAGWKTATQNETLHPSEAYSVAMSGDTIVAGAPNAERETNQPTGAVYVFGTAPTVETGVASAITRTSATLSGTVNPNGEQVSECNIEYGVTSAYGRTEPCSPPPGSGESAEAVSAAITGLGVDTTYHYRVVATNPGGTRAGTDRTFTTLPNPPTVVTGSATSITRSSATLNGTVNPNGSNVSSCEVEYGTSPTLASPTTVSCGSPGAGSSPVPVSVSLTGLSPVTTYYYRVDATNAGGTSNGSIESFTTLPNPPTVVTGAASAVTDAAATLNGTVNPNGGTVSSCEVEYGTSATLVGAAKVSCGSPGSGSSPVAVSASVTGLTPITPYYFRVDATNAGGTTKASGIETFTTLPEAPAVVTGSASGVTDTSATLNGTVNPNGGTVSSCEVEYGTSATLVGAAKVSCGSPGSGSSPVAVSASVTGLTETTTYYFRVDATNAGGTTKASGIETFTTRQTSPTVVTGAASAVTDAAATLNGTVNPNGGTVSSCEVEYGTSATLVGAAKVSCGSPGSGSSPVAVSASVTGLTPITPYYFRVDATNAGGTTKASGIETFTTLPEVPAVVTGSASGVTDTSATLNGTVNPNGGTVSSCEVEYGTSATLVGAAKVSCGSPGSGSSPVAVSASVTGLTETTTYYFRVDATNAGGTTKASGIETFTTRQTPPTVVTGAASAVTDAAATLNGTVNPNGGTVSSCEVEYGTSATLVGAAKVSCGSPGSGSSPVAVSASVTGLTPITPYYFRVDATNAGGTTKASGIETFTTLQNPPEFGRCIAVGKGNGKYSSSGCTTPGGKDGYEWDRGVVKAPFTTKLASGAITLASAVKTSNMTCTGETSGGEYTGVKTVGAMTLTLTGCTHGTEKCASIGAAAGEIVTSALEGELGIEKAGATNAKNKIGLDLYAPGKLGPVMEFGCGSTTVTVQGSVIVPIKADKMLATEALKFKASKGKQKPESFVGVPKDILEESFNNPPFEQTGLSMDITETSGEPVEVNSVL